MHKSIFHIIYLDNCDSIYCVIRLLFASLHYHYLTLHAYLFLARFLPMLYNSALLVLFILGIFRVFLCAESTKSGRCPYLGSAPAAMCDVTNVCASDDHCEGAQKCCVIPSCKGPVCVRLEGQQQTSNYTEDQALLQGPTSEAKYTTL